LLNKRPQDSAALTRLGNLLLRQKRAAEALANYQAALALEPNSPELLDAVGNAQWLQGRKEEALGHWQKALAANPPVKLRAVLQEKLRKAGGAGNLER
jgi:tetratricopeptide (TPR) repeat protein